MYNGFVHYWFIHNIYLYIFIFLAIYIIIFIYPSSLSFHGSLPEEENIFPRCVKKTFCQFFFCATVMDMFLCWTCGMVFDSRQNVNWFESFGSMKRKRGSKAVPTCGFCGKTGHYRTSCPQFASCLLKACTKHSSVDQLQSALKKGTPVKLNVQRRQQRTLKRARGKRFQQLPKNASSKKKKLRETRQQAKLRNRKKEKSRREKPKKRQVLAFKLTEIQSALKELKSSGWLRQEKFCPCGDKLVQCPLRMSVKRGTGRVYLRCAGCRRWYDVVAFSSLPVLKMPLPLLLAAMKRYFQGPHAEAFARCAEALGMSGTSKTCALARLWNALRTAEQRCMDHTQSNRVLTGLEMAGCFQRKHTVDVPIFPKFQGSLNVHSKAHAYIPWLGFRNARRFGSGCHDCPQVAWRRFWSQHVLSDFRSVQTQMQLQISKVCVSKNHHVLLALDKATGL